jgi:CubicO group peptidase (beta-lactamase class C family)
MKKLLIAFVLIFFLPNTFSQIDEKVIDRILQLSIPTNGPGGVLLVFQNEKILYQKAFGFANMKERISNTTETVFQIGSISKMMTATGILRLVEEGKIHLTDTLTKFIPDFNPLANKVTIENLLLHNSGIKSFTAIHDWNPTWESKRTLDETIDLVRHKEFDFPTGEKFLYNNSGYALLAKIIEIISGLSYDEFMKKNVFIPLGMNQTRHGGSQDEIGFRAKGYSLNFEEKKIKESIFTEFPQLSGAGSIISTVNDILTWDDAMRTNKLLKKESWQKATSSIVETNFGDSIYYGYGWVNQNYKGHKLIWHNGGMAGFLSSYLNFPDDKTTIIFLSNSDFINADGITRQIAAYLFNFDNDKRIAIQLPEEKLKKFEGKYNLTNSTTEIKLIDGNLVAEDIDYEYLPRTLIPTSDSTFFVDGRFDIYLKFDVNPDETVNHGKYFEAGTELIFYRDGYEPKIEKVEMSENDLKLYEGIYEFAPGVDVDVYFKNGKLRAFIKGQPEYTLIPTGNHNFALEGLTGFKFIFEVNPENKVLALTSSQPNGEFKAIKK